MAEKYGGPAFIGHEAPRKEGNKVVVAEREMVLCHWQGLFTVPNHPLFSVRELSCLQLKTLFPVDFCQLEVVVFV